MHAFAWLADDGCPYFVWRKVKLYVLLVQSVDSIRRYVDEPLPPRTAAVVIIVLFFRGDEPLILVYCCVGVRPKIRILVSLSIEKNISTVLGLPPLLPFRSGCWNNGRLREIWSCPTKIGLCQFLLRVVPTYLQRFGWPMS